MINKEKFSLNIKLTDKCNLRCKYCPNIHGKSETSKEIIDKAIDLYTKNNWKNFYFELSGGEVTEVPHLLEYALSQIPKHIIVKIITNGTNTRKERIQKILSDNAERLMLVLSVDGDKKEHDQNRIFHKNKAGTWDSIDLDFLFSKNWNSFSASCVATLNNVHNLYERIKYIYSMGFREIGISVDHTRVWNREHLWLYEKALCNIYKFYLSVKDIKNLVQLTVVNTLKSQKDIRCLCKHGYTEFTINIDGTMTPCKGISDVFERIVPWDIKFGKLNSSEEDFGFSWGLGNENDTMEQPQECNSCLSRYRCGCIPMRYIKHRVKEQNKTRSIFDSICKLNSIEDKVVSCNALYL